MHTLHPLPPRRHRILPWVLFALLWCLATGFLVAGSHIAEALAG